MEQLESSLALHLEQTSRLLAATSGSNKAAIAAQSIKLKKSVAPQAEFRFNEALDKLSQEIQHAQHILRRDLAVARERAGVPKPVSPKAQLLEASPAEAAKNEQTPPGDVAPPTAKPGDAADALQNEAVSEVPKEDALEVRKGESPQPQETADSKPATEDAIHTSTETKDEAAAVPKSAPSPPAPVADSPPVKTSPPPPFSPAPEPAPEPATNSLVDGSDFDFGLPTTDSNDVMDSDNISALLPGLQDYANNQTDGNDPDFDAIFGDGDLGDTGGGQGIGDGDGMGDFMDFDFEAELGGFGDGQTGEGEAGDGKGNLDGNGDGEMDLFQF